MAVNLLPVVNGAPFLDSSGNPLSGGKIYSYTAGSSTPETTYTTYLGDVANANPIILNSGGYPATGGSVVEVWGTAGVSYKLELQTSAGVSVWIRDRISGINDAINTSSEWVAGPAPTYISATSFSLVGDQTSTFQVGRRVKTTNSGGTIYSTIVASAFGAVTTVTVVNDSGTLDSGLSAVSYGLLSSFNPADPRSVGVTVAAHATTSNIWASEQVVLTGGAVTFTDIADAPYVGAVAWVKQNAAHVWTEGAVFDVQGGSSYTAAAGDWIRVYATTVSTFEVTVFRADDGAAIRGTTASTFTFDGSGGSTGSLTLTYQKVGQFVTLNIPAALATTGTSSGILLSNTAIPAAFRPASIQDQRNGNVTNNGAAVGPSGMIRVNTNGTIGIYRDGSGSVFTNTASAGLSNNSTVTYFLG